ncbi:MAG: LytR C-terminal domain-containing protein [Pseudomonadota bacterium]
MTTLRPLSGALLGASLLLGCSAPPLRDELLMQPALQVHHSGNQAADAYYQIGRFQQERGELDLALTAYNYAIARDAHHEMARVAAAVIHAQQGRLDQAKATLLAVVAEYPNLAQPYNNLGYVHYLQGDYEAAAIALRRAVALEPGNAKARANLQLADAALASRTPAAPADGGAAMLASAAAPAVRAEAPPALLAPAAVAATPQPARMELVQLEPHVYQLRRSADSAPPVQLAAAAPAAAPAPAAAAAATAMVTAAAAAPAARVLPPSRLEVANGNGVTGMAKRVSRALVQRGIAVARITNERSFRQPETRIHFRVGYEQQAQALVDALHGHARMVLATNMAAQSDLRLVLGRDAVKQLAVLELNDGADKLAAR